MPQANKFNPERLVTRYFDLIRALRKGQREAVEGLLELWDDDGVFEFAGAPPVTGTYKGKNAIHVLYQNRVAACGMPLRLTGAEKTLAGAAVLAPEVALGVVDTHVNRMRTLTPANVRGTIESRTQQVAAGWITVIGTGDERGFQVTGNHLFTFKKGRISALKVTVSPRAQDTPGLSLQGLAVADIGRLSLAAWCVV